MTYRTLTLDATGPVATITLNRPDKRNAISTEMIEDLLGALGDVEAGPARVVILTGAGKTFCSGMDLDTLLGIASQSPLENLEDSKRMAKMFRRIWSFSKPTIAAVNGAAIAGGCGIATLCDFTVAVPAAKFGYPEVRIGFVPGIVSVFLRRQVGEKITRDLLLSGRIFDAAEAHRVGLVSQIAPSDGLQQAAQALAESLLAASPSSLNHTKKMLREFSDTDVDRELDIAIIENAQIRMTADFREGLSSFLEKRAPRWSGK